MSRICLHLHRNESYFLSSKGTTHTHKKETWKKDNKKYKVAATLSNRRDNNINFYHTDKLYKENI